MGFIRNNKNKINNKTKIVIPNICYMGCKQKDFCRILKYIHNKTGVSLTKGIRSFPKTKNMVTAEGDVTLNVKLNEM